ADGQNSVRKMKVTMIADRTRKGRIVQCGNEPRDGWKSDAHKFMSRRVRCAAVIHENVAPAGLTELMAILIAQAKNQLVDALFDGQALQLRLGDGWMRIVFHDHSRQTVRGVLRPFAMR